MSTPTATAQPDLLIAALGALLRSETGKSTLRKLSEGQGTATADGIAWLAAKELHDRIHAQVTGQLSVPAI